jgi:gamma-carbonic anhydrase
MANLHMSGFILPYRGIVPTIAGDVFVAPTASVIGDVEIGAGSGIWFSAVVRGDTNCIRIGERTNLQDGAVIHGDPGPFSTHIGSEVVVGHGAILHGCTVEDGCLIGMGARILNGAVVESGAVVAAGALVAPGKRVKGGEMWAGSPARFVRPVKDGEREAMAAGVANYVRLAREYREAGP